MFPWYKKHAMLMSWAQCTACRPKLDEESWIKTMTRLNLWKLWRIHEKRSKRKLNVILSNCSKAVSNSSSTDWLRHRSYYLRYNFRNPVARESIRKLTVAPSPEDSNDPWLTRLVTDAQQGLKVTPTRWECAHSVFSPRYEVINVAARLNTAQQRLTEDWEISKSGLLIKRSCV